MKPQQQPIPLVFQSKLPTTNSTRYEKQERLASQSFIFLITKPSQFLSISLWFPPILSLEPGNDDDIFVILKLSRDPIN